MFLRMPKMIQIRNVPDALHRQAKARAALAGMSLSDYLMQQLRRNLERPTRDEILRRVQSLPRLELQGGVAGMVREGREEREQQLSDAVHGEYDV